MRKLIALPLVTLAFAANVWALGEARFSGKVLDSNKKPVADATITIDSMEAKTFHQVIKTNAKGEFAVLLADGSIKYRFTYEKAGVGSFVEERKLKFSEPNVTTVTLGAEAAPAAGGAGAAVQAKGDPAVEAYNAGAALANSGDVKGAIVKFEAAVAAKPDLTPAWSALTKLYARDNQWQKAIDAGTKALVDNDDPDLNAVMAQAYEKTGDKAKAAEYRAKAPKNASSIFNEAAKYINAGDTAKAEPLLKQAIEADATFAQAYYELGMIYAGQSKNADAKKNLQKYLELAPTGKDVDTAKQMLSYMK